MNSVAEVRLRPDLLSVQQRQGGRTYWLVRDPLARKVFRLSDADFQQLADPTDADPQLISEAAEQQLLLGTVAKRSPIGRTALNPLYVRLRGVDADRGVAWLAQRTDWLFSLRAVLFWGCVIASAIALLLLYVERATAALPSFHTFFGPENWVPLAMTLAATKVIHELAHGSVCRRHGRRCPEIGILLLCGTPCLYCDVTDSWSLPNRWQRASVMLAGVYVEAILAAVATWVWWFAQPGPLYFACMNLMFVCGVSTLVFNLNPLMRFDGYYVLSDLLNIPNLRQQALAAWRSIVVAPLAGESYRRVAASRRPPGARALAVYHAAASAWRLFAIIAISGWILSLARAANLLPFGWVMVLLLMVGLLVPPVRGVVSIAGGKGFWKGVNPMRRAFLITVLLAVATGMLVVPVPYRIAAEGIVDFSGAATIYVRSPGTVNVVAREFGDPINAGQTIMRLENATLRQSQIRLASQSSEADLNVATLRRRALSNPALMEQWDSHQATAASLARRVRLAGVQVDQLVLNAPATGTILPVIGSTNSPVRLSDLCGQHLDEGHSVCRVGDPACREVVLEVDADQRRFIQIGSPVRIQLVSGSVIQSEVTDISSITAESERQSSLNQGKFRVVCGLPDGTGAIPGTSAKARILTDPRPLYRRIAESWARTF